MFYLYHNNDLNELAGLFGTLRGNHRVSPLAMDTVLVPNRGVGRWLTMHMAQSEGIAANIRTALPGGFIWQLLAAVNPAQQVPEQHFEADGLPWHLYFALPAMRMEIPAIATYLVDAAGEIDEVRRWQLATQLADVFDRYLVYRTDMLANWESGTTPDDNPGRWQAQVWRYLTAAERLGTQHRARVLRDFVTHLRNDTTLQQRVADYCPQQLYCFGLLAVAPDHLRLLYALGEFINVHFLLPNPSEMYWGDMTTGRLPLVLPQADDAVATLPGEATVEHGHPLLGALGRMARDTLRVLYSDEFSQLIDPELGELLPYQIPNDDSLLHRIQADIVTLDCSSPDQGMTADDASLEIHACHSPLREVQVLQDQLLDRLAADDKRVENGEISAEQRLAPRDIIVMLPDVATYAPAIRAVFGGAPADRYLPFGLADRARSATHPVVTCFATLIDLPLSRWQASELLDLLAVPAVMRRFRLDADELATVTTWVRAAGIRWGRDADHRGELGAGAFAQNSWQFGLDRLLLGVVQADDETLTAGVAPWSNLEGGATAALGKLWRFERTLSQAATTLTQAATPGQWQARLNELVDAIIEPTPDDADEQRAVDNLRQVFAQLETAETCTRAMPLGDDRRVSWQAMRDMLHGALDTASERQPFLAGGITFCGMVPLRAVPFRMVCILGLNDGEFPRQDSNRAFNVIYQQPRLGDRNTRDDDRLLFLQALTAARDAFYISYIGQDIRSGEALPPSPIVGETLAFIHQTYCRDWTRDVFNQRLIHQQPMQPFSARYFSDDEKDSRIFTFAGYWRDVCLAQRQPRSDAASWLDDTPATPVEPIETVDLTTLTRFYDDPPKAFFEHRLGLRLEHRDTAIDDAEPLHLDNLEQASLRRRLFERAVADDACQIDTVPDALELARGNLPPPPRAADVFAPEAAIVNALLPAHHAWQQDAVALHSVDIDLTLAGMRLTGRVPNVGPTHLCCIRPGRLKTKYRLRYWIEYLAVVANGHDITLTLGGLGSKKQKYRPVAFKGKITPETARNHLQQLLTDYVQGQARPLPFHPDLADDYNPKPGAEDKAFNDLDFRFRSTTDSRNQHHLLRKNCYFPLLLNDDPAPLGTVDDSPFLDAIDRIWMPMHTALEAIDVPAPISTEATP